ncbi:hypothetical protein DPX16_17406 [Anabarilius grahami]|uniref:Uncharacterized protein n=1 Tax=Anabarilius grahami TaxID=495550 RepID=A0A3N0XYW5_ANAGA|nr:hypothetical protein DPX16_17406 [Anabarilius grahami]
MRLIPKGRNTSSRQSAVRQFLFVDRLSFLSVPHRRLKLVLVGFFSASELVSPSGHLIILIGCSATATCWYGKAFHHTQAQNGHATWPLSVERWFGVSGQLWTQTLPT